LRVRSLLCILSPLVDPRPPDPQHHRQKFVGQRRLVAVNPVIAHQQPPGEPLLDRLPGGGYSRQLNNALPRASRVRQADS
jgi:hypothetical protein